MIKRHIQMAASILLLWIATSPINANGNNINTIKRLTYSGSNTVHYPCLSDDGKRMLYVIEIKKGEKTTKAVKVRNIEEGKEIELFQDGKRSAEPPFENAPLILGSKPPVLSGNGHVAIFSLSIGEPGNILDHYLAVVNSDGTNFRVIDFPINALIGKNLKSLDFISGDWERISNYTVSSDGSRSACMLKGHLGPRRYGNPSGIVFLDILNNKQRTILAPNFNRNKWEWSTFPRRPLTGGGWAFCMSGNGQKLVFGAQSSTESTDYDLYVSDWDGKGMKRITDFQDRWFSMADISHDGENVVFYYNGRKKQGIGTYTVSINGTNLKYLESKITSRIEFFDMSGNGRYILYKHIYKGIILDLQTGQEKTAFNEDTSGYVTGLIPMDFPRIPAFWGPKITNFRGDRILLIGPPQGKETPEIYLLRLGNK